jgi:predicted amidohydrolase
MIPYVPDNQIVAAIQYEPQLLQVRDNIALAQQLTFEAAAKGARVIVLPELAFSGFTLDDSREAMLCAQPRLGYQTEAFVPIARRFGCHVVFGYVELYEGKLYNSAAIVGPQGLEGNAQKHNLYGRDNLWAQPSEALNPVVMTAAGRLGVLLCRDAMNNYRESYAFYNPKSKFYRKGDVDTIALVTNWGGGYAYPDSAWVELVESTRANLIVSNRVGKERDMKFKGGSCIIDRDRRIWTHGSNFTEAAVVGGIVLL